MYYLCFELIHSPATLLGSLASAWYLIKWLVGDLSRFEMLFACNHWLADLLLPATVSNQPAQSDLWPLTSTRHFPPRNCRLPDIFLFREHPLLEMVVRIPVDQQQKRSALHQRPCSPPSDSLVSPFFPVLTLNLSTSSSTRLHASVHLRCLFWVICASKQLLAIFPNEMADEWISHVKKHTGTIQCRPSGYAHIIFFYWQIYSGGVSCMWHFLSPNQVDRHRAVCCGLYCNKTYIFDIYMYIYLYMI